MSLINEFSRIPNFLKVTESGSMTLIGNLIVTNGISSSGGITGSYTGIPGLVSGSSQVISSLPSGIVSGSSQLPSGIISGSSQLPSGIISGSSQLNNATIANLTITNLTTINQTASVFFTSGSTTHGDFGNDIHGFTGSVQISGSFTLVGSSTATSYNGTINATNGVVSGSSQITYASISSIPAGIVSGSSQTITNLPTGVVSGSAQTILNLPTGTISGSSQVNVMSTTNIVRLATTGSNSFVGNQTIAGNVLPEANGTRDLGSAALRWSTVYTSDLSLNNGIGDWTIVEGEDDLFLYNNKKGKVYKFALTEVDPNVATPKKS
jgi:hypothetical protein